MLKITFIRYVSGITFIRYISGYIRDIYVFHCIITIISRYNISNMAAHCDNVTAI
jgi:hypothetical protein